MGDSTGLITEEYGAQKSTHCKENEKEKQRKRVTAVSFATHSIGESLNTLREYINTVIM